jgi:CheY-like chemotaxis protein/anti-sigma regulatory factor (Ser/Thr protein kinase)
VSLDPSKLKQVLYNYISNAIKFTPEEGDVTVRVRPEGKSHVRLEVEDTGIGIRPEDLSRLFVEFQQLDATTSKKYQGTGLGLALTKRIVEAQGGQVGVRSQPGKGSIFFAVLPKVSAAFAVPGEKAPPRALPVPGARAILVVEDDPQDRAWIVDVLTRQKYDVTVATSGAEAIDRLRESAFDLVTLDLLLPDMNGSEVLQEIRNGKLNRDVPVVIVTVIPDRGILEGFWVSDVLQKPVRSDMLVESVRRAGIPPKGDRSVLVVDDDPKSLRLAEKILKQAGFSPLCHSDPKAALKSLETGQPAAIILDLLMPEFDGFQFLRALRALENGRRVPVIVWTVKELTSAEEQRLKSSARAIVEKSAGSTEELLRELVQLVPVPEPKV